MLTVYHAPMTRSLRVVWILEELGLAYAVERIKFRPDVLQSPEFRRISPAGRLPALLDGDLVMIESGAIVQYLLGRFGEGRLVPATESPDWPRYLQWFFFAEATAMPAFSDFVQHSFGRPEPLRISAMVDDAKGRSHQILTILDEALADHDYVVGSAFTAADIMLGQTLLLAEFAKLLTTSQANIGAYLSRLKDRPALQRALKA